MKQEELTVEQIIGGHIMQFAKEFHSHNGFTGETEMMTIILKHKVESCKAMLERVGYRKD